MPGGGGSTLIKIIFYFNLAIQTYSPADLFLRRDRSANRYIIGTYVYNQTYVLMPGLGDVTGLAVGQIRKDHFCDFPIKQSKCI